jgi:hypothetical protein
LEEFLPRKNLWFYPDGSLKGSKFEKFREAWDWLNGKGNGGEIVRVAALSRCRMHGIRRSVVATGSGLL